MGPYAGNSVTCKNGGPDTAGTAQCECSLRPCRVRIFVYLCDQVSRVERISTKATLATPLGWVPGGFDDAAEWCQFQGTTGLKRYVGIGCHELHGPAWKHLCFCYGSSRLRATPTNRA